MGQTSEQLKSIVRNKYDAIARQEKAVNQASCCGATSSSDEVYTIMADEYEHLDGYAPEADLGLGCGLPTQFAKIQKGDTVIDLGSGAGNDAFIARHETGAEGKVIGVDFTPSMIQKARVNTDKLGFNNVEFREGDIENLPVGDDVADVIVSNCVLNLVPDKAKVISEIYRTLKPGGHFSISDIVLVGEMPERLKEDAELYAGCISGAIQKDEYLGFIHQAGFRDVEIQKEKVIKLPDDLILKYLTPEEAVQFKTREIGIFSITVFAEKPGEKKPRIRVSLSKNELVSCCEPGTGCC